MRKLLLWIFCCLVVGSLISAAGLAVYSVRLCSSARALIDAVGSVTSPSEVKQQAANLRNKPGMACWKDTILSSGEETYEFRIENTFLRRLHLVPPTMLGATIAIQQGKIHHLSVVMFTGAEPNTTSGVWIQEWFVDSTTDLHVNDNRRPWKATVDLASNTPVPLKKKVFELNANCLVKLGGCKSAEDILPDVWNLRGPVAGRVPDAADRR